MLKNVTVTLPEPVAHWARKRAAEENLSLSRYLAKLLEGQMRLSDDYWQAYREWTEMGPLDLDAEHRSSREDAHARR